MTLDIREGDTLVVGALEYPIKACNDWNQPGANSRAFGRMAKLSCSTKRAVYSGQKRTSEIEHLTGLKCTPLDPVNAEVQKSLGLETPMELLQTFIADADGYVRIFVERLKR